MLLTALSGDLVEVTEFLKINFIPHRKGCKFSTFMLRAKETVLFHIDQQILS